MERDEEVIDLKELFGYLIKKLLNIFVVTGVCGIAALLYSLLFITPMYESTTTLLVINTGTSASTSFMLDCIEVVNSGSVAADVISKTGLDYTYSDVSGMMSVNNPTNTRVLELTIRAESPELAQQLASAYAEAVQSRVSERLRVGAPEIIEAPTVNPDAVSPNTMRNAAIGLLAGFVLSCGFYVCRYMLDDSVRKIDDIERLFGIKALAAIPNENIEISAPPAASKRKQTERPAAKSGEKGGKKL